ncbi:hypothetical protein [Pseudomonas koreensis]|uniref:Uncharacterized protein n=1 Tax=Pseudomonas koreensis TaxID=198620 RepID=A0A9X2XJE1_9PSED|nr:hypothetical protein [Pseudomonas koreensis]MCU7249821.1 hypothetical protein [Pseudomonas koreensis]
MQAFTRGRVVVEFGDFRGEMVRHEWEATPAGARHDRFWVKTDEGHLPLDLYNKHLEVNQGDEISVLYGCVPNGELRSAVCVFNHTDSRLTSLSDGKVLHGEILPRRSSVLPLLACIATSAVAAGFFGWWGAPAGMVIYYLLKAEAAKRNLLLINGLNLHMTKLSKRYVREASRSNISRLLARTH